MCVCRSLLRTCSQTSGGSAQVQVSCSRFEDQHCIIIIAAWSAGSHVTECACVPPLAVQGEGFELYEEYCKNRPNSEELLQEMREVEKMFFHVSMCVMWWYSSVASS